MSKPQELETTRVLVRVALTLDLIQKMREAGATADEALWALRMAAMDLELEVVEGYRQRMEGLQNEINYHTGD